MKPLATTNFLKTIIAALTIILGVLTATPSVHAQEPITFVDGQEYGFPPCKVIQPLDKGLLLYVESINEKPGQSSGYATKGCGAREPIVILLAGYPDAVVDEELTKYCVAKYAGTFQYTTTGGSTKTVRKFTFVRKGY